MHTLTKIPNLIGNSRFKNSELYEPIICKKSCTGYLAKIKTMLDFD